MSNYNVKASQKPLKGQLIVSNSGTFNTLTANSIQLENVSITGVYENGIFQNVTINNGSIINTPIGLGGESVGYFTDLYASQQVTFLGSALNEYVSWDYKTGVYSIGGTLKVHGCSYFDNIEICVNTISATNTDGDINLVPNGYGGVYVDGFINNVASTGNFTSTLLSGSFDINAYNNVNLSSSTSSMNLSSFAEHNIYTLNGDINLDTELGGGVKMITHVALVSSGSSSGLYQLTSGYNHNLRSGDIINIFGTGYDYFNGVYTVNNIIDQLNFTFTSGNITLTSGSLGGEFIKNATNNINLNAGRYINVPQNIKLVFGNTSSNIVSNSNSNLVISSYNSIYLKPFSISSGNVRVPENTCLYFGNVSSGAATSYNITSNNTNSSGGNVFFDGSNLNIQSTTIKNIGQLTQINSINTRCYDPILTLGDYSLNNNDNLDRGIEYKYYNNTYGSSLGWFGYKNNLNAFTFITNATNNNEIITGIPGDFVIGNLSVGNSLSFSQSGSINVNCGTLLNVNTLFGCGNTLNINGKSGGSGVVNISSSSILLNATNNINIPLAIPLTFGVSSTIGNTVGISSICNITTGDLVITGKVNTKINGNNIVIPVNTPLCYDGTTSGTNSIKSDTSGNMIIISSSSGNIYMSTGNVIVPLSTNIEFGDMSKVIYGLQNSLNIISNVTSNFQSLNNTNIFSSIGNIKLTAPNGDIVLSTTLGNVKIPQNINLMLGSNGSIYSDSNGDLNIIGTSTNNLIISNVNNVYLSAGNTIGIPLNTSVYFGSSNSNYMYSNSGGFTVSSNGVVSINANTTNISSNSNINTYAGGTFNMTASNTNITLIPSSNNNSFNVKGNVYSSATIDTGNLNISDPNTLINYNNKFGHTVDVGFLSGTAGGWFGVKYSTDRFTFYSSATNNNNIITGTVGDIEIANLFVDNNVSIGGNIDLQCNSLNNVSRLTSCNGDIVITASNIHLSASNTVSIPYYTSLLFGTTGNTIVGDTYGNLNLNTLNSAGTIVINGNLQVNGVSTNVYSTITNIQDPIVSIGGVTGPVINDAKDRGIEFKWATNGQSKTGFFGYQNLSKRFVFIPNGTNIYEVYYGAFGSAQFDTGYFNNLDLSSNITSTGSSIFGLTNINGNGNGSLLNISSSNIKLIGNTTIPFNNYLFLGSTTNSLIATTDNTTSFSTNALMLNVGNSITINNTTPVYYGNDNSIFMQRTTSGDFTITNTSGTLNLYSSEYINVLDNIPIHFGSTCDQIYSNNKELYLIGYNGVNVSSNNITLSGNVNITGNLTGTSPDIDLNRYILPLGTSQILTINSITNVSSGGSIQISLNGVSYISVGDNVIISNSNSVPTIDGIWSVVAIVDSSTFVINNNVQLTTIGSYGIFKSNLTINQGRDVGIQVNYWSTNGNAGGNPYVTSGSINYKTGFFGYKLSTNNWTFYDNATISNNIVTGGELGNIQINTLNTNNISGFVLTGNVTTGSNAVVGSNFIISGGSIDGTPIGTNVAQSGRFNNLSNTVSANLSNVSLSSTLMYSFERFTLSSLLSTRNPSLNTIVSFVSVNGVSFNASGTLGNTGISDGQIKTIACSSMGTNCTYSVYIGADNLIAPNISNNIPPTTLQFSRSGQSVQMIYDGTLTAWIILGRGCSVF